MRANPAVCRWHAGIFRSMISPAPCHLSCWTGSHRWRQCDSMATASTAACPKLGPATRCARPVHMPVDCAHASLQMVTAQSGCLTLSLPCARSANGMCCLRSKPSARGTLPAASAGGRSVVVRQQAQRPRLSCRLAATGCHGCSSVPLPVGQPWNHWNPARQPLMAHAACHVRPASPGCMLGHSGAQQTACFPTACGNLQHCSHPMCTFECRWLTGTGIHGGTPHEWCRAPMRLQFKLL